MLDADMANIGAARRFVRTSLGDDVPADVSSDLQLATSELVTNAFEHGSNEPVRVTVRRSASEVSVTVASTGDTSRLTASDAWRVAGPDRRSGRGLGIVRELADDVDVVRGSGSIEITVRRRLVALRPGSR